MTLMTDCANSHCGGTFINSLNYIDLVGIRSPNFAH